MKLLAIIISLLIVAFLLPIRGIFSLDNADLKKLSKIIDKGALLLDVRTEEEFKEQHIDDSLNIPLSKLENSIGRLEKYKQRDIVVFCRSGRRAEKAKEILERHGFKKVVNGRGVEDIKQALEKR